MVKPPRLTLEATLRINRPVALAVFALGVALVILAAALGPGRH